jgi:hypothetical protein
VRRIKRNGLPKYCSLNRDRDGNRFVRFRHNGIDVYLTGAMFTEAWWKQYSDALQGIAPDRSGTPRLLASCTDR